MDSPSLLKYFQERREEYAQIVTKMVYFQTYSGEKENINRFLDYLQKLFSPLRPQVLRLEKEKGDILVLTFFAEHPEYIVFLGHADTVNVSAGPPVARREGNRLFGNGSYDMKGGIALFYFALQASAKFHPDLGRSVKLVLVPDEETGSQTSSAPLLEICGRATAVLLAEPPAADGGVKLRRKAIAEIRADLAGRAAHSGLAPEQGRDANRALARLIALIDERIKPFPEMTFNPGVIAGGSQTNMVSAASRLQGEIRTFANSDLEKVLAELETIGDIDGVQVRFANCLQHPALEASECNRRLYERAARIMAEVSYPLTSCSSGGASDGSSLSAAGIPVLDGIGIRGEGAHAAHEHVDLDDFPFRALLLTRLVEEI